MPSLQIRNEAKQGELSDKSLAEFTTQLFKRNKKALSKQDFYNEMI